MDVLQFILFNVYFVNFNVYNIRHSISKSNANKSNKPNTNRKQLI